MGVSNFLKSSLASLSQIFIIIKSLRLEITEFEERENDMNSRLSERAFHAFLTGYSFSFSLFPFSFSLAISKPRPLASSWSLWARPLYFPFLCSMPRGRALFLSPRLFRTISLFLILFLYCLPFLLSFAPYIHSAISRSASLTLQVRNALSGLFIFG